MGEHKPSPVTSIIKYEPNIYMFSCFETLPGENLLYLMPYNIAHKYIFTIA